MKASKIAQTIAKTAIKNAGNDGVPSAHAWKLLSYTVRAAAECGVSFADSKNDSENAKILADAYAIVKKNA